MNGWVKLLLGGGALYYVLKVASESEPVTAGRRITISHELSDEHEVLLKLLTEKASTNGVNCFYDSWNELHEYDQNALQHCYRRLEGLGKERDARIQRERAFPELKKRRLPLPASLPAGRSRRW